MWSQTIASRQLPSRHVRGTWIAAVMAAVVMAHGPVADAAIDLLFQPVHPVVTVGDIVEVRVFAISDSDADQLLAAAQIILEWDPAHLQLLGNHQDGAVSLLFSGFPPNDPYNINQGASPPEGPLGFYQAWALLGTPVAATPAGTLLTTLVFEALAVTAESPIDIVPSAGDPLGHTIVYDGAVPGLDVTGLLFGTSITIVSACPADLNGDHAVDVLDLLILLNTWGDCPKLDSCPADLNGDGVVDVLDLLYLLDQWGNCP
jgi:hypothetical protein